MDTPQEFILAVTQGNTDRVTEFLATEPGLVNAKTAQGTSVALLAMYYGKREMAEYLASQGATLTIFEAAALGKLDRVQALVSAQPSLVNVFSPDGFHPLGFAAFFGHPPVAEYLLAHGADPNLPTRNTMQVQPLHSATASQQLEIARLLLAYGADPNGRQENDFVPLHNAAQNGDRAMIELLLAHGARIDASSRDGRRPVDFAKEEGHAEIVAWLS